MENIKDINLAELFSALVRRLWLILLCSVIAGALSYVYTSNFIQPIYRSRITVYVNNALENSNNNNNSISANDLATSQRLVSTYINILRSDRVLQPVADSIGGGVTPSYIRSLMAAASLEETEVFEVVISHNDPQLAAKIANAIADVAPEHIAEIVEGSSTKIIDRAKPASSPSSPNKTRNTLFGLFGGAVLASCIIILQTLLDVRVKGEEDLAQISNAPVLGLIPDLAMESKGSYGHSGYKYSAYKAGTGANNEEADV